MTWLENLLSPITITFLIIAVGYFIGKIKIFNISLDLAGVLIMAVFVGFLITITPLGDNPRFVSNVQLYMKMFSSLGTALFVSVIGISAGYSITAKDRRDWISAMIGGGMTVIGIMTMRIIALMDSNISNSSLFGILCGALTTTPGLSAVCEQKGIVAQQAVLGYASAYLLGVVFTVVLVQIIARNTQKTPCISNTAETDKNSKATFGGLIQICLAVIFGNLFGCIEIPILHFSLGSSGGILCVGLLLGNIIRVNFPDSKAAPNLLNLLRNFGLVLFFVGAGLPAGIQFHSGFDFKAVIYGAFITLVPLISGYLFCLTFSKSLQITASSVLAGGMTSTPAIGVLIQSNKEVCLSEYSFSYVAALITIMISMRMFA